MKTCPNCKRPLTKKILAARKKQKSERLRAAFAEAKRNGDPVGRRRKTDYAWLRGLRQQGYSIREITRLTGCSIGSVQRALSLAEVADEQG